VADVATHFAQLSSPCTGRTSYAIVLHGGASDLVSLSAAERDSVGQVSTALLGAILAPAHSALERGASALDVAEAAVRAMEDSGQLNAGRGATRNRGGDVELDAAVMNGADGRAGAIAAVRNLRNPVSAARIVMEQSPHVLLVGADGERFVVARGAESVSSEYFRPRVAFRAPADSDTVGAVARDRDGNLAAATSTGGIFGKLPGRVGDSPVIGAGTYADNATAAVSATGQGEYFMRLVLAHEVAAMMRYGGLSVGEAVTGAIRDRLDVAGGKGGLIAVGADGSVAAGMNTAYMPRGWFAGAAQAATVQFGK
jgi:beta-aspartyl-peptidase (threonine type)